MSDIPGASSCAVFSQYAASLQDQSKAPDIHSLSLRASTEELLASFNSQDQGYTRSRTSLTFSLKQCHKTIHRNSFNSSFHHTCVSRIEFQFCCLWIGFVSQGGVCFHSVVFGSHAQDRQCAPCIFVDHLHKGTQVLTRLHAKQDISPFFLQIVSQDSAQELFRHTISIYHGVSRIEFQFCCLYSVGFGVSWTFTAIFRNDSCGSTLFVSLYISFS